MKLEYNKDSNVGIAPFGYDPRSKLIIKKKNMTLNEIFILETGNETFADRCEKVTDNFAIQFALWCDENVYEGDSYIKALEIFKQKTEIEPLELCK